MNKKEIIFVGAFCLIVVLINILSIILKDFLPQIAIDNFDDHRDMGIIDGFSGGTYIILINVILIVASIIATSIMMFTRKTKTAIIGGAVTIALLLIFSPIYRTTRSGGIAGIHEEKECSIVICYGVSDPY